MQHNQDYIEKPFILVPCIKEQRMKRCLEQKDLAKRLKMKTSQLSKIETGETKDPGVYILTRIAKAIDPNLTAGDLHIYQEIENQEIEDQKPASQEIEE